MATLNIVIEIRNVSILSFVTMSVSKFRSKMYQFISYVTDEKHSSPKLFLRKSEAS